MLFLLYGLSALLCIAALVAKLYFGGFAFPLALLIPAFVFLVVGNAFVLEGTGSGNGYAERRGLRYFIL